MPTWYKDLVGTRKEAKELLAKFNARDESRSLMPIDGALRVINSTIIFSDSLCISPLAGKKISLNSPTFRSLPQHYDCNVNSWGLLHIFCKILFCLTDVTQKGKNGSTRRRNRGHPGQILCCLFRRNPCGKGCVSR